MLLHQSLHLLDHLRYPVAENNCTLCVLSMRLRFRRKIAEARQHGRDENHAAYTPLRARPHGIDFLQDVSSRSEPLLWLHSVISSTIAISSPPTYRRLTGVVFVNLVANFSLHDFTGIFTPAVNHIILSFSRQRLSG
jgi:hypothetical protein